jgi:glycine cleavage system H protein
MSDTNIPGDLLYTTEHEWARVAGDRLTVGITAFAVEKLGDVTLVEIDVKAGDDVAPGKAFGTVDSTKTTSELFAPIAGKVVEVNGALAASPELVNEDCYGKGWMVVIQAADGADLAKLLGADAYRAHVDASPQ